MAHMDELFGSNVFNDAVMQQRLPKDTYKALKKTIDEGRRLDPQVAAVVAHAMKDWAVEKGYINMIFLHPREIVLSKIMPNIF